MFHTSLSYLAGITKLWTWVRP